MIYQKKKETEKSIEAFNKVHEIDENLYEINYLLAETYNNVGRFDEALSEYQLFLTNFEAYCEQKNEEGQCK